MKKVSGFYARSTKKNRLRKEGEEPSVKNVQLKGKAPKTIKTDTFKKGKVDIEGRQ
ncbi:MAG: hypothetical protein K2P21_09155 [Lachnospiraceae bacterium]|nr:hypothetical protein [Lachnospiraceae bacterium]